MHDSLELLIRRWRADDDIGVLPPYGEATVRTTFFEAGIEPSKDLIALYGAIGGMEAADLHPWRLWSLSEIEERKAEANEFGVLFSDYLIDSWAYRVKPNDVETSAVYIDYYDGNASILVAPTLKRFFDLYLANADR